MHRDRLLKLADYLENVVAKHPIQSRQFDMDSWSLPEDADLSCGTASCAFGHACMIPEFQKAGLTLELGFPELVQVGSSTFGYSAAHEFFAISRNDALYLFDPEHYGDGSEPITIPEVVARLREVANRS